MLDLKFILSNTEDVETMLKNRNCDFNLDNIKSINNERKQLQKEHDTLRAEQKNASKKIGEAKKKGESIEKATTEMKSISDKVKSLASKQSSIEEELKNNLLLIPNIPHKSVPVGLDENANQEVRKFGEPKDFPFKALSHDELGEQLGIIDFERAAKLSGSRFAVLRGLGAKLEMALINFMLDVQTDDNGYEHVFTPYMVNSEAMIGTGQLPKFEEDLFKTTDGKYLIPTAEVPITNLYAGETLKKDDLPMKFAAFSPCFRSEAGSYGKDVKGLIRQHQFHKVELVRYSTPEESYEALEEMISNAEEILKRLEIAYRVITLCTGDMGFSASKTYDIEVWLPSQKKYREISSCSNCIDFQARRMNLRYKNMEGKLEFVHTLNGSGLAIGRTLVAVLENYQNKDGTITIPKALKPYMNNIDVISK